jgi:hypothetical protein
MMPYRNTGGVLVSTGPAQPACFASVTRDVANGIAGNASTMLSSRSANSEIISATVFMNAGTVMMIAGERFGATLDAKTTPTYAVGALLDRSASQAVSAVLTCPAGGGGVRTSFAAVTFEYLLVVELGTVGVACPPRLPQPEP